MIRRATLLPMQKRSIQRGRPVGTTTFDSHLAQAFGGAVRARRTAYGIAQETLANLAGIERSHTGKIERGEHMPTLAIVFRLARALGCSAAELIAATEAEAKAKAKAHETSEADLTSPTLKKKITPSDTPGVGLNDDLHCLAKRRRSNRVERRGRRP